MLRWLRRGMGGSAMGGVIGALEEFFNPAAARARQELQQHERVIPVPSPGDKLLDEGKIVIRRRSEAETQDCDGSNPT